ncbi:MAG: hypothetical protein E6Q60_07385 [Nitrosomonas oligotropha]|uniref:Guanylate cyclase domain-containing protein n=1 Tax=Nitrosomonas oligotropha TaxID=42354 RepID=A0A5C7VTJ2_9PROT|nr:hypothetical protein [Nitrosomonas sp.]TXI28379.1 MAG: hypothetical protein E6Q60_07385 [Nitrosomonas oligotropha]
MDKRWAIYIDIEGFSALYPDGDGALWALNRLILAIHRIGKNVFPESPDRLFAHQLGDGFLIISDFHEENLDRAASIAILLMKYITRFGVFARATIAEGDLSDITGCYPDEVMNDCDEDTFISSMGEGLMTIFPVMGAALINAVGIDKISPKGPLFTMPSAYKERLSSLFIIRDIPDAEIITLDWIHTEFERLVEIRDKAILEYPNQKELESFVRDYITKHKNKLTSEWIASCSTYLGVVNI